MIQVSFEKSNTFFFSVTRQLSVPTYFDGTDFGFTTSRTTWLFQLKTSVRWDGHFKLWCCMVLMKLESVNGTLGRPNNFQKSAPLAPVVPTVLTSGATFCCAVVPPSGGRWLQNGASKVSRKVLEMDDKPS